MDAYSALQASKIFLNAVHRRARASSNPKRQEIMQGTEQARELVGSMLKIAEGDLQSLHLLDEDIHLE